MRPFLAALLATLTPDPPGLAQRRTASKLHVRAACHVVPVAHSPAKRQAQLGLVQQHGPARVV